MKSGPGGRGDRPHRGGGRHDGDGPRRKPLPPAKTHAEEFYYLKQMNSKCPMLVVLDDGEEIHGWIEWYDQDCIKVHREEGHNLLLFKRYIRYIRKVEDA